MAELVVSHTAAPLTPHPIPGEMGENGKLIDLLLLSEHSTVVFGGWRGEGGRKGTRRPSVAKYCYGKSHKTYIYVNTPQFG